MYRVIFLFSLLLLVLSGCQAVDDEVIIEEVEAPEEVAISDDKAQEPELEDWEIAFARQRFIGDLLYDALNALEDDRLLTPVDDNAHGRYQRVLAYDPDNELALQGLKDIVSRYLELTEEASRHGRFATARTLLDRARFVDEENPDIEKAEVALKAEMNTGDLVFELNLKALIAQTDEVRGELSDIAGQARDHEAFLLITAPEDEQARWMYTIMRESVNGYRLRGNIELGSHAIVRLRMPDNDVKQESKSTGSDLLVPQAQ
ncbi:MAG: hypothetical protein JKY98_02680 [Gammaproteobacteria bacterium]|nr:hypothetical protein [Gammaproteobacteria bacterium]